jgi:hypothetical protein
MEDLIASRISWLTWLLFCLLLVGGYFLLHYVERVLNRVSFQWVEQGPVREVMRIVVIVYEPAALLLVASSFFIVRPVSNGLILLLILLVSFAHIRNYFSGKLLAIQGSLDVGMRMRTGETHGRIAHLGRLGMRLQTNEGLHHIDYGKLQNQGFALLAGEEVGGLYRLRIRSAEGASGKKPDPRHLMDLLASAPFPEWTHTPEIYDGTEQHDDEKGPYLDTQVLLKEEDHLHELIRLIKEWGYVSEVLHED